ncbi:MAG TPA: DNA polymerase I [Phycisphaerae bacterium]|nr:DNA polymerase I [Phycisphaerae bacterium]HON66786.1 DNA polymerase I [Phycisphaerae bacterium]HOQ84908.1 DNA polymerase I [Phycisphaerae bacterium]
MSKRFFLIDGLSQIFRCYYAPFRPLTAPSGEPTRATYVFTEMLLKLIREQQPDYLAMAMDSREEASFRKQLDPAYKAQRDAPPEDLAPQIARILSIVESQDIPILAVPGYEADDVMATICRQLAGQDVEVFLVSKDKDLDQVLTERVKMFDPATGAIIGPAELEKAKGYRPEQAVEVQTLCGDTVDNVPGVKGVGPKKAAALIAKYGTAENVIAHADELTPAMRANVKAFAETMPLTRQLVTLRCDVPMQFDLERCRWTGLKGRRLQPVFAELGFRRLADQFADVAPDTPALAPDCEAPLFAGQTAGADRPVAAPGGRAEPKLLAAATKRSYILVDNEARFREFLAELRKQPCFAFDTETDNLNPVAARLAGLSFSWEPNTGYYLPICGLGDCLKLETVIEGIRPVMTDPAVRKVGQNVKYDLVVLRRHGLEVRGVEFDTMIASFVLDSSRPSHGVDALARDLLGLEKTPITALIGKGANQITFDGVDTRRQCDYSAEDADVTWQLAQIFREQLAGSDLEKLFRETEMPLVEVLAAMEYEGVRVDTTILARQGEEIGRKLDALREQIYEAADCRFNIDSPKQLAVVLFDKLGLPVVRKTKTGRSTDAETLDTLAFETNHPVPALVKEYRELIKLKGTYIDTLPQMICPQTGRIHAGFNQTSAITGRLSSSDPNLQNIPIRTEMGRRIREAFVPRDADHVLLTGDYSQIELRVLAHFCKDEALRAAFAEDRDIHQFVAAQVFGVPLDQVTKEQRSRAKAVNFGIIYGQTAYGLSRATGMSVGEADGFIRMYFMRYPGIRMFIDATIDQAKRDGFVRTILGRRRAVPEINSRNRGLRTQAERLAVNTVIQGSAADLIKRAMIAIHRRIVSEQRPSRMIIQVHDELVFDVPRTAVEAEAEFIRHEMTTALPLEVPIKVDLAWGDNWLQSK